MKACICKNISDKEISKFNNIADFIKQTKATTMCGTCRKEIERMFKSKI